MGKVGDTMFKKTVRAFAAMATIAAFSAGSAFAQTVVLKANDGSVDVTGELISFEDGFYTIQTLLGQMRMSASRVSCDGDACPQSVVEVAATDFTISGSGTIGDELMPLLLEGFASEINAEANIVTSGDAGIKVATLVGDQGFGDPFAAILVASSGASEGFDDLLEGVSEIGMSSRRILPVEARALRDAGAGSMIDIKQEHVVAVDSLLLIVSQENPIDTLSVEQVAGIYSGQITNWSEVGGANLPISVYAREEGSGTRSTFESRMLAPLELTTRLDATIIDTNVDMSRSVVEDPGGIGYAGYAFQRGAKSLNLISECGIRTRPDGFSAKTEEYPLQRRLYVYNRADNVSESAQQFIDYMTTDAADGLVSKSGFIDLSIERQPQSNAGGRMRGLIRSATDQYEVSLMRQLLVEMLDWDRLSTTFRFSSGSNRMDAKAQRDMERLVAFLETQPTGTEIAVVGYTDNVGPFGANQELSESRASDVADIFIDYAGDRLAGVSVTSMGFGELSPADCNETDSGREINRRVEIWIKNQ